MTATMWRLQDWAEGWLAPEMRGGLRGRSPDELHDRLNDMVDWVQTRLERVSGGKIDLRKCFDTVDPYPAIKLWESWGAPDMG